MHVLSINVGQPRQIRTSNGAVLTGIFKSPVQGPVALREHNLAGDRQADLTAHGGPWKAVYLYPHEHYSYWTNELPDMELPFGVFGENLTTEGISEESVCIGDQFKIGSAIVQVTQPRMPCYKLALRFGRVDMVKRFWKSGRSGIYFSIVQEGELQRGDSIQQIDAGAERVSVADVVRLFKREVTDPDVFLRAMRTALHGSWKEEIRVRWAEAE
jgi:MOSC domain-containing protein YiiM